MRTIPNEHDDNLVLRYSSPAKVWTEALPLGNGRIGAMVFGDVYHEKISLNEDTLWSGGPKKRDYSGNAEHTKAAEELMLSGKPLEAQRECEKNLLGPFTEAYEPLGDLHINFRYPEDPVSDYSRTLSLEDAVSCVSYKIGGKRYTRECFVSHPDQAFIMLLTGDEHSLDLNVSLSSELIKDIHINDNLLCMEVTCPTISVPSYVPGVEQPIVYSDIPSERGTKGYAAIRIHSDGIIEFLSDSVSVSGASFVLLQLCVRSDFESFNTPPCHSHINAEALCTDDMGALGNDFSFLKKRHLDDYHAFFLRQNITLPASGRERTDTYERLRLFAEDENDSTLPVLLYQFGRYLMISGSRENTQPLNLQGIWNASVRPPWSCNYTVNINTEMNYWPAEICALGDLHRPLFDLIRNMSENGEETAKGIFCARGACANHNTDIWAHTNPVGEHGISNGLWGWWPMAFGWLCRHLWEHYEYSRDDAFLKNEALPMFRKAALFFIDTCRDGSDGYRTFRLATSPENRYLLDGNEVAFAKRTEMCDQIIRENLKHYLYALTYLGLEQHEADDVLKARELLSLLPPTQIGKDGRLLEWDREQTEIEPTHRHISHLYGLFPAEEIDVADPALCKAVRRSLEVRGDEGTGWSLGWKINVYCRLRDGDHTLKLIKRQMMLVNPGNESHEHGGTYPNLFDAHPPFQIDGNFAMASGVARMLIDSSMNTVYLLPALPSEWKDVSAYGLCGANGTVFGLTVKNGVLVRLEAKSVSGTPVKVVYGSKEWHWKPQKGETVTDPEQII